MKTKLTSFCVSLLLFTAATTVSFAQDDSENVAAPEASVVYEAPVIYNAPVVYQAPVIYYAPVYYLTASASSAECSQSPEPPSNASTVFVIGAHGGSYGYANDGCANPSIIYFGR